LYFSGRDSGLPEDELVAARIASEFRGLAFYFDTLALPYLFAMPAYLIPYSLAKFAVLGSRDVHFFGYVFSAPI
jgi:hypothetical protein